MPFKSSILSVLLLYTIAALFFQKTLCHSQYEEVEIEGEIGEEWDDLIIVDDKSVFDIHDDLFAQYRLIMRKDRSLPMTHQLFFSEIVNPQDGTVYEQNIFEGAKLEKAVPKWFIFFSMPECVHCDQAKTQVKEMAKMFHNKQNQDNILVASVNCADKNAELVCQYFGTNRLPRFAVVDPETQKYYQHPISYDRSLPKLTKFAQNDYLWAFTQYEVGHLIPAQISNLSELSEFLRFHWQGFLEENNNNLNQLLGADDYSYLFVSILTTLMLISPFAGFYKVVTMCREQKEARK